jgi:ABC-type Mn2+/Zn2+ transport system permease subunit
MRASSPAWLILILCVVGAWVPQECLGATVEAYTKIDVGEQIMRFFSMRDGAMRNALLGSILLGVTCGLLGSYVVVRRVALLGDALSHAVLPGVAAGFLWSMSKNPLAIFVGATISAVLGAWIVDLLTRTTRLREDAALGIVLAGFFGVGICLVSMMQRLPGGNKSGIDKFLFGQAAAIGPNDLSLIAIVTGAVLLVVGLFYKQLLASSFDPAFASVSGMPIRWIQRLLVAMLAFAIVVALQAVGVVLVSAMLVIPAASAYLLTDRFHKLLFLAAAFGVIAAVVGAFLSFLGNNLPTGPCMVLGASAVFGLAFFFGPRHGLLPRLWLRRRRDARMKRENTLKTLYRILEGEGFRGAEVSLRALADIRRETLEEAELRARALVRPGFAEYDRETRFGDGAQSPPVGTLSY